MDSCSLSGVRSTDWLRWTARGMATLWAAYWVFEFGSFIINDARRSECPQDREGYVYLEFLLILITTTVWLAWHKEKVGRVVLCVLGLVSFVGTVYALTHPRYAPVSFYSADLNVLQHRVRLVGSFLFSCLPLFAGLLLFGCKRAQEAKTPS